eukprot:COSAG01_NODE_60806_length_292_cov_2.393782_1_plen_89_part_10
MIRVYLQLNGVVGGVALREIDWLCCSGGGDICSRCQLFLVSDEPLSIVYIATHSSAIEIHCQTQAIETHSNPFQRYLYNYHLSNALYRV